MPILYLPDGRQCPLAAVATDVDGVIRDTGIIAYEAACTAIERLRGTPPSYHRFVCDLPSSYFTYFSAFVGEPEAFRLLYWQLVEEMGHETKPPFSDVATFGLHVASLGLPLFAVSSHTPEKLERWFEQHKLRHLLASLRGGSKEKHACLMAACIEHTVPPGQVCYIGDMGLDMRAALKAGMIPIGITRGHDNRAALLECGAALVVDHLSDLMPHVR